MSRNLPRDLRGDYTIRTSKRLVVRSGLVDDIAARTATAGWLFTMRWSSSAANCYVKYVGAKFILTVAHTSAQLMGCDLIVARSYSANASDGTAIDIGATVTKTNSLDVGSNASLFGTGAIRVAGTAAVTAGTQTLDANPIGIVSDWQGAVGATVPLATSGAKSDFGTLFSAKHTGSPLKLVANEGIVCRNLTLMDGTGVGYWDFCVEWDEGNPNT